MSLFSVFRAVRNRAGILHTEYEAMQRGCLNQFAALSTEGQRRRDRTWSTTRC